MNGLENAIGVEITRVCSGYYMLYNTRVVLVLMSSWLE